MDWTQCGFDAGHSDASPAALPAQLAVRWAIDLPPIRPAWPDQPRLNYDTVYRPLIVGGRVIVASPADDSVAAYELESGRECWRFISGGPMRLPPASDGNRVFAGSDDGWLYALDVAQGNLLWKFKGAPKSRLVLGNGRLIDTWCVRGGPVVADGQVYFAAGIWPFMGIFIHCLDAATGKPIWSNSGDGDVYMVQPHGAQSFGGIAPQGTLVVSGERLLVPGGRTLPACFDRRTGKRQYFMLASQTGNHAVSAGNRCFFCSGVTYDLATGDTVGPAPESPVIDGGKLYGLSGGSVVAMDAGSPGDGGPRHSGKTPPRTTAHEPFAEGAVVIKSAGRLYAGGHDCIAAFDLPLGPGKSAAWQIAVEGKIEALAAGDDHLVAVTEEGRIYCLGSRPAATIACSAAASVPPAESAVHRAEAILKDSGIEAGYAVVLGGGTGELARGLAAHDAIHVIILEPDAGKAQGLRTTLRGMGVYGDRIAVCVGDLASTPLPPYFASLLVAEETGGMTADAAGCEKIFRLLHPYHGKAYLKLAPQQRQAFEQFAHGGKTGKATLSEAAGLVRISRCGGLPGAGNWTHEHADAANTRVSPDALVKAPLGLLWFGGSSHEGILPRHGHGPQPQVLDGRLVIEKVDGLRSMDIYTGRILWEADMDGLGSYYNNVSHQYGANGTGTNYISTPEAVYVRYGRECLRLDPASGRPLPSIPMPDAGGKAAESETIWGYLNVAGDYLIGGVAAPDTSFHAFRWTRSGLTVKTVQGPRSGTDANVAAREVPQAVESRSLFVIQRHTGKLLWSATARERFRHNGVCTDGNTIYAIDRPPVRSGSAGDEKLRTRLIAFDLATGKTRWCREQGVFGTWLSCSVKHGVLIESGNAGRDTLQGEPSGMRAYRTGDGRELWYDAGTAGPPLIHGDWVLRDYGACGLLDGKPMQIADPLCGVLRPWHWTRAYGCNMPAASEHLLTFRSGAAGYYDLARFSGTGNWGGFRSSCTNNLVVAGGILTVPDYTRTCTCSYQNQTSLALYPDPDAEMWTYQGSPLSPQGRVSRLGVNLGAPGNRVDEHGTLWIEYPRVADAPGNPAGDGLWPRIQVTAGAGESSFYCRHSSTVSGPLPWVCSSGALGVKSVRIALGSSAQSHRYTVRLYFAEPDDIQPGARSFSLSLQGREVLAGLDVVKEAGGPRRGIVKQFAGITAREQLSLELTPRGRLPAILSGLEISSEDATAWPLALHDDGIGARGRSAQ